MINLSAKFNETKFGLTDENGDSVALKATEFTIGDMLKVSELQKPVFDEEDSVLKINKLTFARVVCSIKHDDTGEYYWNIDDINDFKYNNYPKAMLDELSKMVNKLNPLKSADETLDSKKNNS